IQNFATPFTLSSSFYPTPLSLLLFSSFFFFTYTHLPILPLSPLLPPRSPPPSRPASRGPPYNLPSPILFIFSLSPCTPPPTSLHPFHLPPPRFGITGAVPLDNSI